MDTFRAFNRHIRRNIPLWLTTALLFLVIAFFGAGSGIEPGQALSLLPADFPIGNHDGGEGVTDRAGCNASGWAADPDDLTRDLQVRILSDGDQVSNIAASEFREDLIEICDEGTCGFQTSLWGLISTGEEHEITAQAFDEETTTWITLPGSPKALTCWGYPEGNHDGSEGAVFEPACNASGWAMDPDDLARDLQVRILADGSQVAGTTADDLREDLVGICDEGTCGFYVSLWGLISNGEEHQIFVQAYDVESAGWVDVDQDPKLLTCQDWLRIWAPVINRNSPGGP